MRGILSERASRPLVSDESEMEQEKQLRQFVKFKRTHTPCGCVDEMKLDFLAKGEDKSLEDVIWEEKYKQGYSD
jgi:hypothetical protein